MFYYAAVDKKLCKTVFGIHEAAARDFCTYHGIAWCDSWGPKDVIQVINPDLIKLLDLCGGMSYRRTVVPDLTEEELKKAEVVTDYSDKQGQGFTF